MNYRTCSDEYEAKRLVHQYHAEGYQAYYLCMMVNRYEVRYWSW